MIKMDGGCPAEIYISGVGVVPRVPWAAISVERMQKSAEMMSLEVSNELLNTDGKSGPGGRLVTKPKMFTTATPLRPLTKS